MNPDTWNDRRDRELGTQGLGPYADYHHEECPSCHESAEAVDMHRVGESDVYICDACLELLRAGELSTPTDVQAAIRADRTRSGRLDR